MKNDLSCEVVMDLLPSYLDGLTSQVTNQAIEKHLDQCPHCRKILNTMEKEFSGLSEFEERQIDYFKKIRRRSWYKLVLGLALVLIILLSKFLIIGQEAIAQEVLIDKLSVEDRSLNIAGKSLDYRKLISRINFDENEGIINIRPRSVYKSFLYDDTFQEVYLAQDNIVQVRLGDMIVWDRGREIAPKVSRVFMSKNPYVGNPSANIRLAEELDLYKLVGDFYNELKTDQEPYGWKLILTEDKSWINEEKFIEAIKSYASVLIATVDNLDFVEFQYSINGKIQTILWTEEDANLLAGSKVKEMAATPSGLEILMENLNIVAESF